MSAYNYKLPDCYIYLFHTDEYFILPEFPDDVNDHMDSTFQSQHALSRTAPVFAYSYSGPRTVQVTLDLHRDLINQINTSGSNIKLNMGKNDILTSITDDYLDLIIKKIQSIALPRYDASSSVVNAPKVAIRFGNDIFIKGVVTGGVSINYHLPIIYDEKTKQAKYAHATFTFTVSEMNPYDADSVGRLGSFRGLTSGLRAKMGYNN